MSGLKDILLAFSGIIISIILMYFTFSNINLSLFFKHLTQINIFLIPLFFLSTFFEIFFRTLKWYFILSSFVKIELNKLFRFEVIALGVNNLLPFRMGEVSKILLVSKHYGVSKTAVFSSVFIERLIDTVMLFSVFIIYSLTGGIKIPLINTKNALYIIIIILTAIYLFFIYSEKIMKKRWALNLEKKHPSVHSFIIKLKTGGLCFSSPWITFLILASGFIQWNFDVLNNYIIAKSLKIDTINFSKAAITVIAGSLSASIPSMPGYFGNYEYAISRICMIWGIDRELSTLFPAVIHMLTYLIITLSAVIFIYFEGISFKNLIKTKGK